MGGHGGLNILPQKRWNVYNFDNREKVRQDEEAAAKEEQLKREESRKREAELRLEQLRTARGLAPLVRSGSSQVEDVANSRKVEEPQSETEPEPESKSKLNHINLFEGIKIFDPVGSGGEGKRKRKEEEKEKEKEDALKKKKMKKKEEPPRTVGPEDEKYRLGYGIAGKGVKAPWYMSKPSINDFTKADDRSRIVKEKSKSSGRKTLEEMRNERLRREKNEREREQALIVENKSSSRRDHRSSSGSNKRTRHS